MIVLIQQGFLWGGEREGVRKLCWVKWRKVCHPKNKGGLGVKDVRLFNLRHLVKWKWRLIHDDQCLWKWVLVDKYGWDCMMRHVTARFFVVLFLIILCVFIYACM